MPHASIDRSAERLHRSGWSCGDIKFASGRWLVSGRNGENELCVVGDSQADAWFRACQFAESIGMLGREFV